MNMDLGQQLRSRRSSRPLSSGTFASDVMHTDVPAQLPSFSKSCVEDVSVGSPRIAASRDHMSGDAYAPDQHVSSTSTLWSASSLEHAKQQLCGLMSWPTRAAYQRIGNCIPGDVGAVLKHGRDAFKATTKDKKSKQG